MDKKAALENIGEDGFFEVKDGKTKILYSSYNGVGKFF